MIDSKELRIGNKLKLSESGLIVSVSSVSGTYIKMKGKLYMYEHRLLDPIPLTAEILEKCGFKREKKWLTERSVFRLPSSDIIIVLFDDLSGEITTVEKQDEHCRCDSVNGYEMTGKLKHLHQLQNLYFALTAKELEINLP